jgi:hypothetical protein
VVGREACQRGFDWSSPHQREYHRSRRLLVDAVMGCHLKKEALAS